MDLEGWIGYQQRAIEGKTFQVERINSSGNLCNSGNSEQNSGKKFAREVKFWRTLNAKNIQIHQNSISQSAG